MKKIILIIAIVLAYGSIYAQSPQAFKYQAIARDNSGEVLTNQLVSLKISLLQDSIDGTAVYVETYNTTSNDFGLINLEIGNGIPESGDFSTIDWGSHSYFVKIEMDETGGTNYQFMGISKLLSVPYALYAGKTGVTTLAGHSATELDDITSTGSGAIITDQERTNFTTAYNWGDHALTGYLTSFTETDPKIGSNTLNYLSKWNGSALVSSAIFDNGNIGIGTNDPGEALDVNGAIRIGTTNNLNAGAIRFNNDVFQGYNGTEWLQLSGGSGTPWITSGSDVYYNSGNVGINLTNPTTELDVNGVITATGGNSTNWNTAFGWGDHSIAGYLTSYTETDPVFGAHAANGITSTNITNWTTAYGWGNHSTAGYLTSFTETDPVFTSHMVNGITASDTINWNTAFGWGDHSVAGYLTSYIETDPIFSTHISSGINATDTANWNEAYGWSNHSAAGYLTSYTETDPVFTSHIVNGIMASDTTNWNTAFEWGDHSTAGYLTSYTETDPQVGANTINYLSKWNGSALVSSSIFDNGNIGIGTTSPGGLLGLGNANTYLNVNGSNNLTFTDAVTGTKTLAQLSSGSADFSNGGEAGGADRTLGNTDNYGLGFKTNNSIRMFIDSLGNVGIGTTNPEAKFTIVQDGDNWNDGLRFDNSTSIWDFNIHSDNTFYIGRDSQQLLEINNSGSNTGLQINSPTGSNSHIKFVENNIGKMEIGYSASGDHLYLGDYHDENGSITIEQTTGNVGIGTITPGGLLGLQDANTYLNVDGSNNLTFTDAVTGTKTLAQLSSGSADFSNGGEAGGADRTLGNTDNYGLGFKTNNSIRMFIDSLGNVGIGTTNPEAKFTIVQDGDNWNDGLRFDNSTSIWDFNIHSDNTFYIGRDSQQLLEINNSGSNTGLQINSPTGSNSHIKFVENNIGKMEIGYSASGDHLYLGDYQDENGSIIIEQTTGNVGIGTTTPGGLLGLQDANTYLNVDASNNLTFTDVVIGTKTLAELVDDADADPTNEFQTLSVTGNQLSISNGNFVNIFSGDYTDLTNKPNFTGWDQNVSDDFSGNYNDLTNKPGLANILANGNSAGSYSIDMNSNDLNNVDDIFLSSGSVVRFNNASEAQFYNESGTDVGTIKGSDGSYSELHCVIPGGQMVWLDNYDNWLMIIRDNGSDGELMVSGTKNFVEPHPYNSNKEIVYACIEGPEAGTYARGKATTINGKAVIKLPDHFGMVTSNIQLTAHITPAGKCNGLYVEKVTTNELIVKELNNGDSNVDFYYNVNGIRKNYENYEVIRDKINKPFPANLK